MPRKFSIVEVFNGLHLRAKWWTRGLTLLVTMALSAVFNIAFATPVTYNLVGTVGFHIQGSAYVGVDYQVLGQGPYTLGHDVAFSGDLLWDVTGTTTLDWGSPGWSGQFIFPSVSTFHAIPRADSGVNVTAPIDVNVDLGPVQVHEHYDPGAYINPNGFDYTLNPTSATTLPAEVAPGAGPWSALLDPATLAYGLCLGLTIGNCNVGVPFMATLSGQLLVSLLRDGVTASEPLGNGSALQLGIAAVPDPAPINLAPVVTSVPGCQLDLVIGCGFDLLDYGVWWNGPVTPSDLNLSLSGTVDGSSSVQDVVIPGSASSVPEPATIALLGLGFAGLGFARRRKQQAS
jgi:hypothetical protein